MASTPCSDQLLEGDQDGNESLSAFEAGERLAQNGPEGKPAIDRPHRVTGRCRGCQEVARPDGPVRCVDLAVDLAHECDRHPKSGSVTATVEDDRRPERAGAADDARDSPIVWTVTLAQ